MFKLQTGLPALLTVFIFSIALIPTANIIASSLPIIIISPNWRDIDLQLSPSTVSMFSAQQIDSAGVQNTQELQNITPGLSFTSSTGIGQVFLRGIGGTISAAGSPRVATFLDGVYLPRAMQSMQEFFDIKRVEVIKGPYGVHLGRNVVGGAVSILTQDPQPYKEANFDVLYGSSNQQQLRGTFNVPVDNNISLRVAGLVARRDGYSHNIFLDKELDDQDYYAWRGKLRYQPSNKLDVIFSVEQNRQDDTRGSAPQPDPDTGVNGGIVSGGVAPAEPREVTYNEAHQQNNSSDIYNAKVSWNKGTTELQSITAYQNTKQDNTIDMDATNIDFASNFPESDVDIYSQEFRLISVDQRPLGWVAGMYLSKHDSFQQTDIRLPLYSVQNLSVSTINSTYYALFGEINYRFTSDLQGRVGVRYNYDQAKIDLTQTVTDPSGVTGPAGVNSARFQQQKNWHAVTPEFGLTYNADANTFYYGKISRGYKGGGYSDYTIQPAYNPEFMWAYETGIKADFPAKQLRINAALFYYDYSDMQLLTLPANTPAGTLPIITNAAESAVKGIDLQAWYRPLSDLELTLGATLLDAWFKEFISVDPNNPAVDPDRSGDQLPMAPKLSLLIGADYQWRDYLNGELQLSAYYKYQSEIYFNPYHDEAVHQDGYGLLNASLRYSSYNSNWYAELYGSNLTDELYAQNIIRIDPVVGTLRYWGEPRTAGFRLGFKY